jgi:hypothetical protein
MDQPDGPVTREEFRQEIAGLEGRLTERMRLMQTQIEDHTTERTRDMQTEVIRVFVEFQQRNESRDGSLAA